MFVWKLCFHVEHGNIREQPRDKTSCLEFLKYSCTGMGKSALSSVHGTHFFTRSNHRGREEAEVKMQRYNFVMMSEHTDSAPWRKDLRNSIECNHEKALWEKVSVCTRECDVILFMHICTGIQIYMKSFDLQQGGYKTKMWGCATIEQEIEFTDLLLWDMLYSTIQKKIWGRIQFIKLLKEPSVIQMPQVCHTVMWNKCEIIVGTTDKWCLCYKC